MDTRLNSEQLLTPVNNALSAEEKQCVYRFKAALKYRKGLWRRIEIQGGQTLADFKNILVHTFKHDDGHLSGFRKRVRRGNTKRYREIELGHIDPLGHGSGADILIAQLELQPGNVLKFIYDFGDWIEHTLTLEAITAPEKEPFPDKRAFPEKGGQYPRITALPLLPNLQRRRSPNGRHLGLP